MPTFRPRVWPSFSPDCGRRWTGIDLQRSRPTMPRLSMAHTINHPALQPLKAKFPDVKFLVAEFRDMVTVVVPREAIIRVCTYLRDDPNLRYDMLVDVNSVDYLNYPGTAHRFAVNYGLTSI